MKYFFILGQNPTLSSAEITAVLEQLKLKFSFLGLSNDVLLLETEKSLNIQELMPRLGGTAKAGFVANEFLEIAAEDILKFFKNIAEKKIYFGFSFYKLDEAIAAREFKKERDKMRPLAMDVKKRLKETGYLVRWVTSKENNLSSVVVKKNKLLAQEGAEFVFFLTSTGKILLGKTLAVQEFEELSFRDYGRPIRSMKVGLMPPKLAKAMINLAKVGQTAVILDPFCGFGTILEEATLWGYENLIGSDISRDVLEGTKQNLEWLAKTYNLQLTTYNLFQSDVRKISKKLPVYSVDAIVTEPYLGPPLQGNEPVEKINQIIKELSSLYLDAFREFKKILKPKGRVAILFPIFHTLSADLFLPILEEIKKIGFEITDLLPNKLIKHPVIKITPRNSIIYSRPDQRVWREVFIFRLKI